MTTENVTNRTVKAPPKTGQNAAPGGISRPQLALRGTSLEDPLLVVTDGAPGLIRAVEECFPPGGATTLFGPSDAQPRLQDLRARLAGGSRPRQGL